MIALEIDIGEGARRVEIDPEDITLGFLEDLETAQDTGKWAPLRTALASLLKLSAAESRAITLRQFKQIGQALGGAVADQSAIPNG